MSTSKRPLLSVASLLLAAALAAGATPATPAASATQPPKAVQLFAPEVVREDLREMYDRLQASHFDLYARRPKAEYDARFAETLRSIDRPLSRFEVEVAFQKFAAFGRVAHSRVDFPAADYAAYREGGGKVLPIWIRVVGGAALVTENLSGVAAVHRGDELLELDGIPTPALLERLEANISADNAYLAHTQLEPRFPALVWLELGDQPEFRLRLRRSQDPAFTVMVPTRSRPEFQQAQKTVPPAFELDWDRREARIFAGGIAYLRPGPFYDNRPEATNPWDPTTFLAFIDQAFTDFLAAGAKSLLIDLRANPGGDDSFSNGMVAWFATKSFSFTSAFHIRVSAAATRSNQQRLEVPSEDPMSTSHRLAKAYAGRKNGEVVPFEILPTPPRQGGRFTGKVYLLIDRNSYSNTVTVAALVQDYGFGKILGEETSDLATTYGAMEQFQLSRTGITVGFPKAWILRPNGNTEARGVVPDLAIAAPIVPGDSDEVLAKALVLVAQEQAPTLQPAKRER